jgi:hypothetical protein
MTRRIGWSALVLVAVAQVSCAIVPPPVPESFAVEYETGSIPPPFNYTYTLTGTFEGEKGEALAVHYDLEYRFREGMTEEELTAEGYSANDDIRWQATLDGPDVGVRRGLATDAHLGPAPPAQPGGDSLTVTIRYTDGREIAGVPDDLEEWQRATAEIDRQARAETGNPRPGP